MSEGPFGELPLSTIATEALEVAVENTTGAIGTVDILAALISIDANSGWESIQLQTTFIATDELTRFPDPTATPGGSWRSKPLTQSALEALETAADIGRSYDLLPVPIGVLALGVVWRPDSGASRALLEESEIDHAKLVALLQSELLNTNLEGLGPESMRRSTTPAPSAGLDPPGWGDYGATEPGGRGPQSPPPGAFKAPPDDPTLRRLLVGAEPVHAAAAKGPWTLSRGDRLLKVHDLRALSELERKRIEAQASIGLALDEITGAVPVLAVKAEGGWLVLETPRKGESLAQHLEFIARNAGRRGSAEFYAAALAEVAETLNLAHDRGLVHGAVEPACLVADSSSRILLVADFAIEGLDDERPGDRYRAPERFGGEVGPSVDQYALAITARDAFTSPGSPPLTAPVHKVLQRAAAPRPADRFPTIGEFGKALQDAVSAEAPRGLAERVAALSLANRAALAPAAIGGVAAIVIATAWAPGSSETAELSFLTSLLLIAVMVCAGFVPVMIAAAIRGRRTAFSLPFASRALVPFAAFSALCAIGLDGLDAPNAAGVVSRCLVISYAGCALLAPARPESGGWCVSLLGFWDRRRALPPAARKCLAIALVALAGTAVSASAIAKIVANDFEYPSESARDFHPLGVVWNLRLSLAREDVDYVCNNILSVAAARNPAHCRETARAAGMVQRADPALEGGEDFALRGGALDDFQVQELPTAAGRRVWNLLTSAHEMAGGMYTEGRDDKNLVVMLSRTAPTPLSGGMRSIWLYQVVWNGHEWRIDGYRACTIGAPGTGRKPADCLITSSSSSRQVKRLLARVDGQGSDS
jgi:hypothetical protein